MALDTRKIETTFGIKPRDWEREIKQRLKAGISPQPGDRSLAMAGYPELYRTTVFLTETGLERWERDRSLIFPPLCCVCGAPATTQVETEGIAVPYCSNHGTGRPALMIESGASSPKVVWVTLTARSDEFLQQIMKANAVGDVFPPWKAFPQHDSYSGFWKQAGEFWITQVFGPFWKGMSQQQKKIYLDKWHATPEWQEWINLVFERQHKL